MIIFRMLHVTLSRCWWLVSEMRISVTAPPHDSLRTKEINYTSAGERILGCNNLARGPTLISVRFNCPTSTL